MAIPGASSAVQYSTEPTVTGISSPTAADMTTWATVVAAMAWAVFGSDFLNPDTPEFSFFEHLGAAHDDPIKDFDSIVASDYITEVESWQHSGRRPSLMLRSKAKQAGHAARVYTGVDWALGQVRAHQQAEADHRREMEWYTAQPAAAPSPAPPVPTQAAEPAPPAPRRIRLSDVIDTGRSNEADVIAYAEMDRMRELYKTVIPNRRGPPESAEHTMEQMSGLLKPFRKRSAP